MEQEFSLYSATNYLIACLLIIFFFATIALASSAIVSYNDYRAHRKLASRLSDINTRRIEELRNPKSSEPIGKPKRGRPTNAERKRREDVRRSAAESD